MYILISMNVKSHMEDKNNKYFLALLSPSFYSSDFSRSNLNNAIIFYINQLLRLLYIIECFNININNAISFSYINRLLRVCWNSIKNLNCRIWHLQHILEIVRDTGIKLPLVQIKRELLASNNPLIRLMTGKQLMIKKESIRP